MFIKQIKVNGKYVKGMIQNAVLQTSQLVSLTAGRPVTVGEIQAVIEELQLVKQQMEDNK